MVLNPSIINAVEKLGYRVTSGDVATQAGIDINIAQRELLALASEAGGHLQVADSGEIAFAFPRNFQAILRNKYWQLKLKDWWNKIWKVLFYLIRISFGIILIASILLIVAAIITILVVINNSQNNNNSGGSRGGSWFWIAWLMPDFRWFSTVDNNHYQRQNAKSSDQKKPMNFLESVFSFIFGDGNPNYNLEERRWQTIGRVIQNQKGAIIAEQITPYLDEIGSSVAQEYEDYMLPILTRFDGRPEVSPEGQLIYHFPELQTTAINSQSQSVPGYLKEKKWRFSLASSGQIMGAIGLGSVNVIGALMLGSLLKTPEIAGYLTGFLGFVHVIYPVLLIYGVGFLTIPLIRYFWVQWKNEKVNIRNTTRKNRVNILTDDNSIIQEKLNYARQFAKKTVINKDNLAYTTETDLLEQEEQNSDKIDAEWQKRLDQSD
ncbi:hypothetical protein [Planktothrix agardhii]|jgi:hypothetical protein|uniref:Uncharacterized protein n=1 Tax=Planktothrix agardhii TaxID=1160 RepID=A0AAD1Q2P2_PLAAG|nr:hypothetical protein [Planktothrix agardhii]BBD55931.1 hypothetical protein NIES204_32500 [Planktothrix agardhii NIES-204]MCB8750176.1 hypothetical protein [Planktothrix agardhii 1810]MCB8758944.1 hypothetical protein [Planktothrix agardhii 1813]MCB8778956.1 hypothetical protein [Planktothrix agardhii 1031]MCB8787387.1 hypothetical protein [Planktothrix agardhii 1025]